MIEKKKKREMREKKDRKSDLFFTLLINIEHGLKTKLDVYILYLNLQQSLFYI